MAKIIIEFDPFNERQFDEALVVMGSIKENIEKLKTTKAPQPAAPIAEVETKIRSATRKAERKQRADKGAARGPNKRTVEPAADEVSKAAATTQAEVAAVAIGGDKVPSLDDVRLALKAVTLNKDATRGGTENAMKLLASFGTDRISEIPEARRGEFIAKARELA